MSDPRKAPEDESHLLGFRNRLIVGALFAAAYIATFGPRTGWLPGVISGVLGGVVVFLLLKEVDAKRKLRRRQREQHLRDTRAEAPPPPGGG